MQNILVLIACGSIGFSIGVIIGVYITFKSLKDIVKWLIESKKEIVSQTEKLYAGDYKYCKHHNDQCPPCPMLHDSL